MKARIAWIQRSFRAEAAQAEVRLSLGKEDRSLAMRSEMINTIGSVAALLAEQYRSGGRPFLACIFQGQEAIVRNIKQEGESKGAVSLSPESGI